MSDYHRNTLKSQRDRIVQRLKQGPVTTIDLRREEDILMPAARIFELRNLGYSNRHRVRQAAVRLRTIA